MTKDNSRIYKYFTINEWLFSTLINNDIFFADSRNFNDPFDSRPIFQITEDKEKGEKLFREIKDEINRHKVAIQKILYFDEKLKSQNYQYENILELIMEQGELFSSSNESSDDSLIRIFSFYNQDNIFDKASKINYLQLQKYMFKDIVFLLIDLNNIGVTCGSLKNDCPVMWGHYGNNHTGVCFEFEVANDKKEDIFSYDEDINFSYTNVEYTNAPIDLFCKNKIDLENVKQKLLHTKSAKWEYENEVRITAPRQGSLKFKKTSLKAVIFGAKSTPKNRYTLCKLLASLGYRFEFKIARIQTDQYEMKIETMNLNDIAGSGVNIEELGLGIAYKKAMNK
ncbi:DUF2971 domain-containing protein [uncultured Kordia sp.]|uniref:DUF2971 domain-containing protein n=1 Tax=uncultured Kordia sp. TaxID=507699 RepID=UPI0026050F7C|nr:DUF2971 domain-containing protein [uncultured Kordia sp.]